MPTSRPPEQVSIRQEMDDIIASFGEWNAHNIRIRDGLFTMGSPTPSGVEARLAFFVQLVSDLSSGVVKNLRVLDLACLEGVFALELAQRGAEVVGIEGRRAHVERARFAARALELQNVEFHEDDVRNLSVERYGQFDVVLCLGILYHLDSHGLFSLLRSLRAVSRGFVVIDTLLAVAPKERRSFGGQSYWGCRYREHDPNSTPQERRRALRSSIDNPESFWLTRPSLVTALTDAGFTSVVEVPAPASVTPRSNRAVFVAFTGERSDPLTTVSSDEAPLQRLPERDSRRAHRSQRWQSRLGGRIVGPLPPGIRRGIGDAVATVRTWSHKLGGKKRRA